MVSSNEHGSDFIHTPQGKISHLETSRVSISGSHYVVYSDGDSVSCVIHLEPESIVEEYRAASSSETKYVSQGQTEEHSLELQDEDICRICHCNGDEGELIRVCRCNGSTKFTHQQCLLSWYRRTARTTCELCLYDIKIYRNGFKPITQWSSCFCCTEGEFMNHVPFFAIHLLVFVMLIMVAAVEQCFSATCIAFFLVCFGVAAVTMYCCGGCQLFKNYKLRWLMLNIDWGVLRYDTHEEQG